MIRYSYYKRELAKLRAMYGEGVLVSKDQRGILVKNFRPPKKYKTETALVYLQVPEGFGYGINIMNSWILLNKRTGKEHLIP